MAFSGDLADYPLAELLFFLGSKCRSGWLTLRNGTLEVRLTLLRGRPVAAESSDADQRLGHRLVSDGVITPTQLQFALAHQILREPRPALGELLVELGYATTDAIQRALHTQFRICLFRLMIRPGGTFNFARGLPDGRGVDVDLALERETLAAIGRADEWHSAYLPRARLRLDAEVTPEMLEGVVELDWPIIDAMLDGARSVTEIATLANCDLDDALAGAARLQARGVLHVELPRDALPDDFGLGDIENEEVEEDPVNNHDAGRFARELLLASD